LSVLFDFPFFEKSALTDKFRKSKPASRELNLNRRAEKTY